MEPYLYFFECVASVFNVDIDGEKKNRNVSMNDIAELIVKKARSVPIDTGIALTCNNARIAKVAVTGGVGLEVTYEGKMLLFPLAEMKTALQSFMTAAHLSGADTASKYNLKVYHANGVPLMKFEWNCEKAQAKAGTSMHRILQKPPLCSEIETEKSSIPFDARGRDGWDIDSVMTESMEESEGEEDE